MSQKRTILQDKAMLVSLKISKFTAKKFDKDVTDTANRAYNASPGAGVYRKGLVSKASLAKINAIASETRSYHYLMTAPWPVEGMRILPAALHLEWSKKIDELKSQFNDAVDEFIQNYPTYVDEAKVVLGNMFKKEDYHEQKDLKKLFGIETNISPVPYSDNFLVKISEEERAQIAKDVERTVLHAQERLQQDLWSRLRNAIGHMAEKLSDDKAIFRNTLVKNIEKVIDILPQMNVTDNPDIKAIGDEIKHTLYGVDPEALRNNQNVRNQTAMQANAILEKINLFLPPDEEPKSESDEQQKEAA